MINDYQDIPGLMKSAKRWLLWRDGKVPFWVNGRHRSGKLDTPQDQSNLGTFDEAFAALTQDPNYKGLGFALGPDGTGNYWQGIDLDDVADHPGLDLIKEELPGYTELSPSGTGYHAIGYGRKFTSFNKSQSHGIEAYASGKYFTVTGEGAGLGGPVCLAEYVENVLMSMIGMEPAKKPGDGSSKDHGGKKVRKADPSAIRDLRSALNHLRADDRDLWIAVGQNLFELGDDGRGLWLTWSQTSEKFDPSDASTRWDTFTGRASGYESVFAKAQAAGWVNPASRGERDRPSQDSTPTGDATLEDEEDFSFDQFSLNGESSEMEERMLEDKFVLGKLALLGQITYFYAAPNAGKTLITLRLLIDAIQAGEIDPSRVYYVNADDNHKGLTHKLKLAEKYRFHMLAPGYKGFSDRHFSSYLTRLSNSSNASGSVVILDTLKKFTDIMSKTKGTDFGKVVRLFSSKGGTLIGLGHVNKHTDDNGKKVHSGTTDCPDDADCVYMIEVVRNDKTTGVRTVSFENTKNRGEVALEASYQYVCRQDATYTEKLESVQAVGVDARREQAEQSTKETQFNQDRKMISLILEAIRSGSIKKTDLIKNVMSESGSSRRSVIEVLDRYEGESFADYKRWRIAIGDKNTKTYSLIAPWSFMEGLESEKLEKLNRVAA